MYNIILLLKFVACFSISLLVLFLCYTLGAYVSNPRVEQKVRLMLSEVTAEEGVSTIILTSLKKLDHTYTFTLNIGQIVAGILQKPASEVFVTSK